MLQMTWKASFLLDTIRLACFIFNQEKYHFLLELLSYVIFVKMAPLIHDEEFNHLFGFIAL